MNMTPLYDDSFSMFHDDLLALPAFGDMDVDLIGFGVGGEDAGTFMRLHLDPTLLATFESPSFDEANAVPLEALDASQSSDTKSSKRAKTTRMDSAKETVAVTPTPTPPTPSIVPVEKKADASIGLMLSTLRAPTGDMRCRYRKDKCTSARTLKKNGSLHSYCEVHRQRSIVNQRRFDSKKRVAARERGDATSPSGSSPSVSTHFVGLHEQPRRGPSDDASRSDRLSTQHIAPSTKSGFVWL